MVGAAPLGRLTWLPARVSATRPETARARTLTLEVPDWPGHRAGQHVDIRLTAEDGYQAQRSYSIASAPEDERVILTVERVPDGEVSEFLVEELRVGDRFEIRGPIGGYFVWDATAAGPLLLIAGGSGVVPLMAMVRHRAAARSTVPARLLYSSRSLDDVIYRAELELLSGLGDGFEAIHTLTRSQPPGWEGYARRVDADMLGEVAWSSAEMPAAFICGPTPFVESAATILTSLGHDRVKTERFGPTGG